MRSLLLLSCVGWIGCATDLATITCGDGTVEVGGFCETLDDTGEVPTCAAGEVYRNGQCAVTDPALAYLPFTAGRRVRVGQGYHGAFSHVGSSAYAIDFPVPEGTVVRAARPGRVLSLREDSDSGCGDPTCADLANSVVIDHGDGTFGTYLHLAFDGVAVEDGDVVARGQPIALSGNTGFSTGPHLHFQVRDILGTSQPVAFAEFLETTGGIAYGGEEVVSENDEIAAPDVAEWSTCPRDLFAFLGVMLDPGASCSRVGGRSVLSGQVVVEGAAAVVTLFDNGAFDAICAPGPSFSIEVPWGPLAYDGTALFTVSAAHADTCGSLRASSVAARVDVR